MKNVNGAGIYLEHITMPDLSHISMHEVMKR
jgi:hypothetical protein